MKLAGLAPPSAPRHARRPSGRGPQDHVDLLKSRQCALGGSFGDHHQTRCRPGEILLHQIEAPTRIAAMRNKIQFKPYHDIPLARNPSFVSWYARQKCVCADHRSYQNVSRETLLSDWSIIPDKLDHSPISLDNVMAEGAGFEPAIRFPAYTLSRRAPSTTRPPLRCSVSWTKGSTSTLPVGFLKSLRMP